MIAKVVDRFEFKGRGALEYGAAGVGVICKFDPGEASLSAGDPILVIRNDGWLYAGRAEDVRPQAKDMVGFFVRSLTNDDVPLGSEIRWGTEIEPLQAAISLAAAG